MVVAIGEAFVVSAWPSSPPAVKFRLLVLSSFVAAWRSPLVLLSVPALVGIICFAASLIPETFCDSVLAATAGDEKDGSDGGSGGGGGGDDDDDDDDDGLCSKG